MFSFPINVPERRNCRDCGNITTFDGVFCKYCAINGIVRCKFNGCGGFYLRGDTHSKARRGYCRFH